ncbi:MAG: N-acetylneuraminate synthase family protein [Patescibacteria group bacterium]
MVADNKKFNFENLFIFDLANNHQGSVEHGLSIINEMAEIAKRNEIRAAIKFQFRNIDTLIHPNHKNGSDNKHIPRFISTRLTWDQYQILLDEINKKGLISICTPFDEYSVEVIEKMNIEIIKVASCSANDWPLLERISEANKPVICSVGGLTMAEIDKVVSFFQHRGVDFALEYCVAIYPTPNDKFHLNQIDEMRNRYPGITIGFSTHEAPDNFAVVGLAYAKGARIFEKHVGVETDVIKLNAYSGNPNQIETWVKTLKTAMEICGSGSGRIISDKEKSDLLTLKRGIYFAKEIKIDSIIERDNVYFAMPLLPGQLISGQWREGMKANKDYLSEEPLQSNILPEKISKRDIIYSSIHAVKAMINNASIPLSHDFHVEISHHYGLDKFDEFGCIIVECINHKEYAKKLVIQLPRQNHPVHFHKKKDETFQVLYGSMTVDVEGRKKILLPGDTMWVPRGVWHGFSTDEGVIFEEVSTRNYDDDSFYIDRQISKMARDERKTYLHNWGRHQFDNIED